MSGPKLPHTDATVQFWAPIASVPHLV